MASQTGKNVLVAFKAETTYNTAPATVTGATQMRIVGGGLSLKKATIQSQEIRSDAQSALGRHGSRSVDGTYQCEMSVGSHDTAYEAVMRSTWTAAATITEATATLTSIITTTNTIQAGGGSWITAGLRVGDVFRLTNYSQSADNSKNLRIKALSSLTITVHGTSVLTSNSTPDTSFTITTMKKLVRPTTPTRRTFYVEEYGIDIDLSEVYGGCRFTSMRINGTPDGMATVEFGLLGASATPLASGASPFYTSPTLSTTIPLVFADAVLSYNGTDVTTLTAFSLDYQITAKTEPVVGTTVSPDVFDNDARVTGSMSMIRQDLANLTAFSNETQFELHIQLTEPESEPKDGMWFYLGAVKLTGASKTLGGDGAMIETLPWMAGMKEGYSSTGYEDNMLKIMSSAA